MPTNKNAQLRYKVLDHCFSDFSRKYTIDDLLGKVNDALYDMYGTEVSLRQIRADIQYMRDRVTFDAPIVAYPWRGKECYYRYSDREFSIFNNQLSEEEFNNLRTMIDSLGRYRGAPGNAWLEEVISNLEYRFGIKSNKEHVLGFEQNELLRGLEFLSDVIDAVVNHTPLFIYYKPYGKDVKDCILHPYHVKQYNTRWFLFGYDEETGKIANRALDRIQRIKPADVPFRPNKTIDFGHYFDDVVGVSVPGDDVEKQEIIMQFSPKRFPYVASKPIHPSQVILDETSCSISITVKPTKELEQQILSFGSDVEVLSPMLYRKQIQEKIAATLKKYLSVQEDCTEAL